MSNPYRFSILLAGLCLLLTGRPAQAQRPIGGATTAAAGGGGGPLLCPGEETPWSHLVDSLTAPLNKGLLTTGILYDRALPLAALHAFGVRQADTTGSAHLRQAYLELWTAAYSHCPFRFTPDQFRERANRVVRHDSVPLVVLDYQFQTLDTLALSDGLLSVQNGLLYDVAGRSRSPYQLRSLVLAAPLIDTLRHYTATFVLPAALLLTNRARKVSGATVDFNDGGPNRSLLPGQSIAITYLNNGRKVVWITVQFNDGSTAQVRSAIYVKVPLANFRSVPVTLVNLGVVEARIPFQDYNSTTSLLGQGDVLAVLHHPDSQSQFDALQTNPNNPPIQLRRPVIIMDGFDPNDGRPLLIGDKSFYNDLENQRILELLNDTHLQRDLIILNFPVGPRRTPTGATTPGDIDGGADYVERNAMVLIELINRLKPMLANDPATSLPYQFTIIGPSMGGLISRYALAFMEMQKAANAPVPANAAANYWEHNTATWVSFDAPHQGAVVPMGDQAFLQFFKGVSEGAAKSLYTNLYSPAAKQMLVHHILSSGNAPAGAPGFRDRFMLALRDNGEPGSLGYPVHLRRVAIADGRLNGQGDFGTPCGKMFDIDVRFRTGNAILVSAASAISQFFTFSSQSAPIQIAACTARYAPTPGTSCMVFEGLLNYAYYGYNLTPFGGFFNVPIYGRREVSSGTQGSYDLAPGGSRPTQAEVKKQAEAADHYSGGQGRHQAYKVAVSNVQENHCFIPTVSALGFQYQSMGSYQNTSSLPDPYTNLLTRGSLVCNNEIPFDDFYAPTAVNLSHVTTDAGLAAFLVRELTPKVATPVFTAAPNAICPDGGTTGTAIFSVANCPARSGQPSTNYMWTIDAGLSIISGQGTPTLTVVSLPNFLGTVTLQVTASRPGFASATATRFVLVTSGFAALMGPTNTVCMQQSDFTVRATSYNMGGPFTWRSVPSNAAISNSSDTQVTIMPTRAGDVVVTLTATNVCTGQRQSTSITVPVVDCPPPPAPPAAYPNPADAMLNLAAPEGPAATAGPRTAVLYNAQGLEVCRTRNGASQLPTADLPEGLYYLLVEQRGHVTRSQIQVKH